MAGDEGVFEVIVATVDGAETTHSYPLPDVSVENFGEKALAIMRSPMTKVSAALKGKVSHLVLANPIVMYRPVHIVRVTLDMPEPVVEEATERLGFLRE